MKRVIVMVKTESITLEECFSKLEETSFDLYSRSNNYVLVIDAGGGDDTLRVLKQIKELSIDQIADVTYVVPVINSLSQLKIGEDMSNYLEGKNVIFALNNIADYKRTEEATKEVEQNSSKKDGDNAVVANYKKMWEK